MIVGSLLSENSKRLSTISNGRKKEKTFSEQQEGFLEFSSSERRSFRKFTVSYWKNLANLELLAAN